MYAAAMAGEYTPASMILDAPIIMDDPNLEEVWRPGNSGGGFRGPMRLREALVQSRNLVSIRLLKELGIKTVIDYAQNFGFTKDQLMPSNNLTLALGSMRATPLRGRHRASRSSPMAATGSSPSTSIASKARAGRSSTRPSPRRCAPSACSRSARVSDQERAKNPEVSATITPPTPLHGWRAPHAARGARSSPRKWLS